MKIGKFSNDIRARIVEFIRSARGSHQNAELARPYVWQNVTCSNNTDYEQVWLDLDFDVTAFDRWRNIVAENTQNEYRCFVDVNSSEYGDTQLRVELKVRVPADDQHWLDHLIDIVSYQLMEESLPLKIYKVVGVYLTQEQIASIVETAGKYTDAV